MNLDTLTVLVMSGAIVAISGVTFILNTVLRRTPTYARLWSVAFVAGILETISYLVWATAPAGAWWASGVGNAAATLAVSFIWNGARAYNGRGRPLVVVSILVAIIVGVAFLVSGPTGGPWAGAIPLFASILLFACLTGVEAMREHLGSTGNGRVLGTLLWIVAAYYLVRLAVFVVAGESSELFTVWFGTTTTTFISLLLVVVAAISMSVLQPIRDANSEDEAALSPIAQGALTPRSFAVLGASWLERARRDREPIVQLEVAVDNLEHMVTAFGRGLTDEAVALVARVLVRDSSTAALVCFRGEGRFAVLTTPPSFGSPVDIADALQTSLVETPLEGEQGVRVLCTFGLSSTEEVGYAPGDLEAAAVRALDEARALSPGSVVAAATEPSDHGTTGES